MSSLLGPARALGAPTATQPDAGVSEVEQLLHLAKQLRGYHWSAPYVERFGRLGRNHPWKATHGLLEMKDDGMVVRGGKALSWIYRPLPKPLRNAKGIRIDLWLNATLTPDTALNKVGVFFGDWAGNTSLMPAYFYEFIHGRAGRLQQFVVHGLNRYTKFEPLGSGKRVHAFFEVTGGQVRGQRDGCPPLKWSSRAQLKLGDRSVVGLRVLCQEFRLIQMSIRSLQPGPTEADRDRLLRESPLGGQKEIDEVIGARLIPRLDDRSFQLREETTALLRELLPLSLPAIQIALSSPKLRPEVRARLQLLSTASGPVTVEPPRLDEAPAPPTTAPDRAPSPKPWGAGDQPNAAEPPEE